MFWISCELISRGSGGFNFLHICCWSNRSCFEHFLGPFPVNSSEILLTPSFPQMLNTVYIVLFFITAPAKLNNHGVFFKINENRLPLRDRNILWDGHAKSMLTCSQMCTRRDECKSGSFSKEGKKCSLFSALRSGFGHLGKVGKYQMKV